MLEQRYKSPFGEIDLICQKQTQLIFIEVKSRRVMRDALEAVTYHQQKRLRKAALYYLKQHQYAFDHSIRFDVIAIIPWQWPFHLKNAF